MKRPAAAMKREVAAMRWALAIACALWGCLEPSRARPSLIEDPRILAVTIDPPEVRPGEHARYRLLAVDAAGDAAADDAQWSFCERSKDPGENRVVAQACAQRVQRAFSQRGMSVEADVPVDACERFGPEVAAGMRPRDPDASGGYYQPVRVSAAGRVAVALHRIACPLPNAPLRIANAYRDRYQLNRNPELPTISARIDGREIALDRLPADRDITLHAQVSAQSAESFVRYDREADALVERRETLQLSWYVTSGELADDSSPLHAVDGAWVADNGWHAPKAGGAVQLWVVLRDERGAVVFDTLTLDTGGSAGDADAPDASASADARAAD